jgi:hypothetical protein
VRRIETLCIKSADKIKQFLGKRDAVKRSDEAAIQLGRLLLYH